MTFKDRTILILLSIITLGIYPAVIYSKKSNKKNTELSVEDKVSVNTTKLIELLGGEENLNGVEYTNTKVKIFFKSKEKVDVESIQNLKNISGVFASSKYITVIVGKQAKALSERLIND